MNLATTGGSLPMPEPFELRVEDSINPNEDDFDPLTVELLESLEEAEDDWRQLAETTGNVFSSFEFAELWWRHFGAGGKTLRLFGVREHSGELLAVFPFYTVKRAGLSLLRFIGHGIADELQPVCRPADRARATKAIHIALRTQFRDWNICLTERVPLGHPITALEKTHEVGAETSPVLDL